MATTKKTENVESVEVKEQVSRPGTAEEGEFLANATPIETVTIRLYKSENPESKEAKDVWVAINGKTYQVKRGVDVEVPYNVALLIEQSLKMTAIANRYGRLKN